MVGAARRTLSIVRVLVSRRWLGIHFAVIAGVLGCIALCWWQIMRADGGNARSLGYAFEWPTFAVIIVVMWIRAMRDEVRRPAGDSQPSADSAAPAADDLLVPSWPSREDVIAADEAEDPELAAYNRRLAALHAADTQQRR